MRVGHAPAILLRFLPCDNSPHPLNLQPVRAVISLPTDTGDFRADRRLSVRHVLYLTFLVTFALTARGADQPLVEIRTGERIAFIGNDFFDRELNKAYIETQLTTRFHDKSITFRNLGYSGDTVWCQARNLCSGWDQFGPPDQGFKRLQKLVEEFNPTLIFIAYGMSESFDGRNGVDFSQCTVAVMLGSSYDG